MKQVWYESKDGTRVPMFVVRHKSTKFDGTAPAIQYGNESYSPDPFHDFTKFHRLKAMAASASPLIRFLVPRFSPSYRSTMPSWLSLTFGVVQNLEKNGIWPERGSVRCSPQSKDG